MNIIGFEKKGLMAVSNARVYGLEESILASGYPMSTEHIEMDETLPIDPKDIKRAKHLGKAIPGSGHDCYLKGITLQFDLKLPEYIWRQLDRYHHIDFVSSQSKMHRILKLDLDEQCNKYVTDEVINNLKQLIDTYNNYDVIANGEHKLKAILLRDGNLVDFTKEELFNMIIANTPCGLMLTARMTTNYLQLKSIINQRENHKMQEWRYLVKWFRTLPMVEEMVVKKKEVKDAE